MVDQESISRSHAALTNKGGQISVRDMGSTNGTFVNDEMVQSDFQLRNGDLVKIGRTIFKFIGGGNIEAAYHDEIYRLTTVDGLTQISNRRFFEEALEREISRCNRYSREMSLVMIDIDHFKQINDSFGHLAGDSVLKQLASIIKSKIRREDVFARYGGEEFALLLPEVALEGGAAMAEKARKLVAGQKFEFDHQRIPVTISAGVAALSSTQREAADVVRAADVKLYESKSTGRNKVSV
jgi:diguanylate cyclase (GGDEF)-like protein